VLGIVGAVGHNVRMRRMHDFKVALSRVIKPKGGPGVNLTTLGDAARFLGHIKRWRQARPHWDYAAELLLKAAETRRESDIEMATAQIERALRVEGWL
jgi:hypothetical protein